MRRIKFRAWNHVTKKYFTPSELRCKNGEFVYITACDGRFALEQFTGLKDKNGEEIYEGDILLSQEYSDKSHSRKCKYKRFKVKVCWDEKRAGFHTSFIDKDDLYKYRYGQWGDFFDCEVIGNIHENPELLEVLNEI